jgi:hypothetical protein
MSQVASTGDALDAIALLTPPRFSVLRIVVVPEIQIDIPRTRTAEVELSPRFTELRRELLGLLRTPMPVS